MTVDEFRALCLVKTPDEIVEEVLLVHEPLHVDQTAQARSADELARTFSVAESDLELRIVGSANLGFSMVQKTHRGKNYPRYRPYSATSDVDVAVVSPKLFRLLWDELCSFAHGQPWIPWDSQRLGDYFIYGWLRPDHFPRGPTVRRCNAWWDTFRRLSADKQFGRHAVRGGLFHSRQDLRKYMRRAVEDCANYERGGV